MPLVGVERQGGVVALSGLCFHAIYVDDVAARYGQLPRTLDRESGVKASIARGAEEIAKAEGFAVRAVESEAR